MESPSLTIQAAAPLGFLRNGVRRVPRVASPARCDELVHFLDQLGVRWPIAAPRRAVRRLALGQSDLLLPAGFSAGGAVPGAPRELLGGQPFDVGRGVFFLGEGRLAVVVRVIVRTETPASASAAVGFVPDQDDLDQDDLDQMARVHAIHDVLDLCPALPLDVRLGLLDHAWALLGGDGRAASEPRRVA